MSETTGKIDFRVGNDTYQTWYSIVGDIHSGVRPLVVLHGGPGYAHHYLLPFRQLHARFNMPVILYDQIGCGESSHPKDVPKEFWTVDLFLDELDNLLEHLGISGNFDLAGHSFGACLAAHYASNRHPSGLQHLIIASGGASAALLMESARRLFAHLPKELRETMEKHERAGTLNDPEYLGATMVIFKKHFCRVTPPKELNASIAVMGADPTVHRIMMGLPVLGINGTFKDWSCVDKVHTIDCPTLLTNGAYDSSQDVCLKPFFAKIPKVCWVTFAESGHVAFLEEPDRYFEVVGTFLTEAR